MSNADLKPKGDYLLLIDASSFIHRSYHALAKSTRSTDGLQTGALAGFTNTLLKLVRLNWTPLDRLPSHCAVILDVRGKNWRHDLYGQYKATRAPYEADLEAQLPHIPLIAEAFNIPCIGVAGYEADDVLASYAAAADYLDVVIASSDKDMAGCVSVEADEPSLILYDSMRDKGRDENEDCLIGPHEVYRKWGIMPWQMADFQALMGDAVDNIPGVPGFGQKTAARLINEFGSIENLIDEAEWDEAKFKAKEHAKIIEFKDDILLSRKLVELKTDVPLPIEVDDLVLREAPSYQLRSLMIDYEFMHLVDRVDRPARRA